MIHIDPFAPANSPQHPGNWAVSADGGTILPTTVTVEDAAPRWIALPGEPIPYVKDDQSDDAVHWIAVADARWEEYDRLLREHGTPEQVEVFDVVLTADWPEDMPTLVSLRYLAEHPAVATLSAEDELAAKLKALDEDGL